MKVTAEHLANLTEAIAPLDTPERRTAYRNGDFAKADAVTDLDKRYRWDLFWAAWDAAGQSPDFLAQYNDAHLDTALRHIVPVLGDEPEIDHAHATATQVAPAPPFVYEPEILAPVTAEELTELITTGQPLAEPTAWADSLIETESTAVTVESIARANINQAVGVTLTDGRSFSTKILAVIVHPGAKPLVLVKGWAYESGDFNPFAVVKYPLAQVADFAPFADNAFVAVG
jgi:hypothetical protein